MHVQYVAERFDDSRRVEEVDLACAARPVIVSRVASPGQADRTCFAARVEPCADLEEAHVAAAVAAVVSQGVYKARHERRPQRVEFRRERICNPDRCGAARCRGEDFGGLCLDESERDRFRQTRCREHPADKTISIDPLVG
jgi:hypothetical protein